VIAVNDRRHAHHIEALTFSKVSTLVHLLCKVTIESTFETVYEEEDAYIYSLKSPSRVLLRRLAPVRQSSSSTGAKYFFIILTFFVFFMGTGTTELLEYGRKLLFYSSHFFYEHRYDRAPRARLSV
jgi:hypothetical protein